MTATAGRIVQRFEDKGKDRMQDRYAGDIGDYRKTGYQNACKRTGLL